MLFSNFHSLFFTYTCSIKLDGGENSPSYIYNPCEGSVCGCLTPGSANAVRRMISSFHC